MAARFDEKDSTVDLYQKLLYSIVRQKSNLIKSDFLEFTDLWLQTNNAEWFVDPLLKSSISPVYTPLIVKFIRTIIIRRLLSFAHLTKALIHTDCDVYDSSSI